MLGETIVPLGAGLVLLVLLLIALARFVARPHRVPLGDSEYFVDAWHLPTLGLLLGQMGLLGAGILVHVKSPSLPVAVDERTTLVVLGGGVLVLKGMATRVSQSWEVCSEDR